MSTAKPTPSPLVVCALLLAVALLASPPSSAGQERPIDYQQLIAETPARPWSPGSDPCGCAQQLRGCLLTATLNLGRCAAALPVGDTLCYLKFELDVLLCIAQADNCGSTCVP